MIRATVPLLLVVSYASCPQTGQSRHAFESLLDAERAFASTSSSVGMRTAFLEYLAHDGILFHGGPVNGISWWEARAETEAVLSWGPEIADVAASGDMGYTSGPWELRPTSESPPTQWGHFVSVWRRTAHGSWKVAADAGISHGPLALPGDHLVVRPSIGFVGNGGAENVNAAAERTVLAEVERNYSNSVAERGFAESLESFVAPFARFYRDGALPIMGTDAIAESGLIAESRWSRWEQEGVSVSGSGDLGFTHGTVRLRRADTTSEAEPAANYLRLWQKRRRTGWLLVVDVLIPFPPSRQEESEQ